MEKAVNTEIAFSGQKQYQWGAAGKNPRVEFKKTLDQIKKHLIFLQLLV